VPAPLGRLPLFVRQGALVPLLRPTIDTLSPATAAGIESFANRPGPLYWRLRHDIPSAHRLTVCRAAGSPSASGRRWRFVC